MGRTQDPGGDYGYDLVHEDLRAAGGRPDSPADDAPAQGPLQDDAAGDHSYDEAHDF
jgi:hypothetical protein